MLLFVKNEYSWYLDGLHKDQRYLFPCERQQQTPVEFLDRVAEADRERGISHAVVLSPENYHCIRNIGEVIVG